MMDGVGSTYVNDMQMDSLDTPDEDVAEATWLREIEITLKQPDVL